MRSTHPLRPSDNRTRPLLLPLCGMLALATPLGCAEQRAPDAAPPAPTTEELRVPAVRRGPRETRLPGEYIVVFSEGTTRSLIDSAVNRIQRAGGDNQLLHRYAVLPGFAARLDDTALNGLLREEGLAYVEENQRIQADTIFTSPADGIDRVDQRLGHDGHYNDHGLTGAGVHLYIIDSGINTAHTEFTGRIGAGYTTIADGRGVEDCHGHGSHVSSTAAGTVLGMARKATLHPVRVLDCTGNGTLAGLIAGVDFVRNHCLQQGGPCVANMSLGGPSSSALNQAVAQAVNAGITVVAAAGNEDADACNYSPASEPRALTVAAIDDQDNRAVFSNWGACVDLFAPGVSILGAHIGGSNVGAFRNGTSMASPHVAGAAAQYLGARPETTPAQLEVILKGSASLQCVAGAKGSPNVLLFSDLNQGTFDCSTQAPSCAGLCGGPGNGCFCDPGCEIYQDCCPDFAQVCR